ncbi:MAG: tetratricopeptide repeat protein [Candidatus Omnitrophota bacterium]|nr:tetratricopeptide repeat protein [Candidatus Omnitrophota bacterium]
MTRGLIRDRALLITAGILASLLLLEICLRLAGFTFLSFQEYKNKEVIRRNNGYRILCVGDSLTALGGKNSYPAYLQEMLNQNMPDFKCSVINKGWIGGTSHEIVSKLSRHIELYKPNMMIVMMGINDRKEQILHRDDGRFRALMKSLRLYKLFKTVKSRFRDRVIIAPRQEEGSDSEAFYEAKIEKNPNDISSYFALSGFYARYERFEEAEQVLKEIAETYPDNIKAWLSLAWFYSERERFQEAEDVFRKSIEVHPLRAELYIHMAAFYKEQSRFGEANEILKKAREIDKDISLTYIHLVSFDKDYKRLESAEVLFKNRILSQPLNDRLYGGLALCYEYMGQYKKADEYYRKANDIRISCYNAVARRSYQELADIAIKKRVKLIYVQYPMRSLDLLLKMFIDTDGIIFVDNEAVFRQLVRQRGYDEYFIDTFGGDFGHCTAKGNQLLAGNIAKSILAYFKK